MLFTSDIFLLINYFSQILWLSVAACVGALLWLRKTQPDLPRPIKVNCLIPIIFIVVCVTLVLLPSLEDPTALFIQILITLSGVPIYFACIKWKSKPAFYGKISHAIERFCQMMFLTVFVDDEKAD